MGSHGEPKCEVNHASSVCDGCGLTMTKKGSGFDITAEGFGQEVNMSIDELQQCWRSSRCPRNDGLLKPKYTGLSTENEGGFLVP